MGLCCHHHHEIHSHIHVVLISFWVNGVIYYPLYCYVCLLLSDFCVVTQHTASSVGVTETIVNYGIGYTDFVGHLRE